jgi:RimJ/RimL family protein N-acetyltransferase
MASFPERLPAGTIELRRWSVESVDELLQAIADSFPELHTWMTWAETMPTRITMLAVLEEDVASFDADKGWQYFLFEMRSGQLVGGGGLHRRGGVGELEIGYRVRTDRTGRGYATQAARALTTAAFDSSLEIVRVKITMDQANDASAAVPRKLGFRLDSHVDHEVVTPGHIGKGSIWAMERSDWEGLGKQVMSV